MLIAIQILVLILGAGAVAGIHRLRPGFANTWLIAALSGIIAWFAVGSAGLRLPQTLSILRWQPSVLFSDSPFLLEDHISWSFALALASLGLATILTAVTRLQWTDWRSWAGSLALSSIGILTVMAGNPITLLLCWAALDLVELFLLLNQVQEYGPRLRVIVSFASRAAGIFMLILAASLAQAQGGSLSLTAIPASASVYLLLAAGFRLGVIPLHVTYLREQPLRQGLGTMLRLTPAAASLILIARVAEVGVPGRLAPILLILSLLAALYGSWAWATADNELDGRPFWILGVAALSTATAIGHLPAASLGWGIACLLGSSPLFLATTRPRSFRPLFWLGFLGLSALPFTPLWAESQFFNPQLLAFGPIIYLISLLFLLLAQFLLMLGYFRFTYRAGESIQVAERWVRLIYPVGIAVLPLSFFLFGFTNLPNWKSFSLIEWLIGPIAISLTIIWFRWRGSEARFPRPFISALRNALSLEWFYRLAWSAYLVARRLISWLNFLLEGQGGILWALVLLALLFSLLSQRLGGG